MMCCDYMQDEVFQIGREFFEFQIFLDIRQRTEFMAITVENVPVEWPPRFCQWTFDFGTRSICIESTLPAWRLLAFVMKSRGNFQSLSEIRF